MSDAAESIMDMIKENMVMDRKREMYYANLLKEQIDFLKTELSNKNKQIMSLIKLHVNNVNSGNKHVNNVETMSKTLHQVNENINEEYANDLTLKENHLMLYTDEIKANELIVSKENVSTQSTNNLDGIRLYKNNNNKPIVRKENRFDQNTEETLDGDHLSYMNGNYQLNTAWITDRRKKRHSSNTEISLQNKFTPLSFHQVNTDEANKDDYDSDEDDNNMHYNKITRATYNVKSPPKSFANKYPESDSMEYNSIKTIPGNSNYSGITKEGKKYFFRQYMQAN